MPNSETQRISSSTRGRIRENVHEFIRERRVCRIG